jgi:hypothetical protein
LDDAFEAGTLEEETYRAERAALKAELLREEAVRKDGALVDQMPGQV